MNVYADGVCAEMYITLYLYTVYIRCFRYLHILYIDVYRDMYMVRMGMRV